jgi:hypothetical protein
LFFVFLWRYYSGGFEIGWSDEENIVLWLVPTSSSGQSPEFQEWSCIFILSFQAIQILGCK